MSLITARRLLHLPRQIHTTSSTLTLTIHLLINNLFLLALSPAILVAMLLGSIPFVTLIFRLLLVGYSTKVGQSGFEWHVRAWANWAIVLSAAIWFWSWAVARGVLRMTCASVIGAWYFAELVFSLWFPVSFSDCFHTVHRHHFLQQHPPIRFTLLSSVLLVLLWAASFLLLLSSPSFASSCSPHSSFVVSLLFSSASLGSHLTFLLRSMSSRGCSGSSSGWKRRAGR